jgi:hypothetical protein
MLRTSASKRSRRQKEIIGVIIRGHGTRYGPARQREIIASHVRPKRWLEIRKGDALLEHVKLSKVSGRLLAVHWLFLTCNFEDVSEDKRAAITRFVRAVRSRGGEIYEAGSGRETSGPTSRSEMVSDACAMVRDARSDKAKPLGRPRRHWTSKQKQVVWAEWFNKDHATNEIAAAAISKRLKVTITTNQIWHIVRGMHRDRGDWTATGASGRSPRDMRRRSQHPRA